MRTACCDICQSDFTTESANKKRCSPQCVRRYRANWMNARHVPVGERKGNCIECGKEGILPTSILPYSKYLCSDNCRDIRLEKIKTRFLKSEKGKALVKKHSNSDKVKAYRAKWHKANRARLDARLKQRKLNDPSLRLSCSVRSRLVGFIRGKFDGSKGSTTFHYVGCTPEQLKQHLESQFKEGMSWENYGRKGWHVDHIKPLASFKLVNDDLTINESALSEAMHYTNLQPLWWYENIAKGDKITFLNS